MPRFIVKEIHLLIVKPFPKGQAGNLTHTFRDLLEYPLGMETGRRHLGTLPLPCSREPVAPEGTLYMCLMPHFFCGCCPGDTSSLAGSGVLGLVFLVTWDCNTWCHLERGAYVSGALIFVTVPGDTSTLPSSAGQWGLCLWVLQDCTQGFLNSYHSQCTARINRQELSVSVKEA